MPNNTDPTTLELLKKKIADFLSGASTEAVGAVTGLKDLVTTNPITTAKGMWESQMKPFENAGKSFEAGNYGDAAIHAANGMVPGMGPWVDDIASEMQRTGDYAKGAGRAVGGTLAGEALGKVQGAAKARLLPEATPALNLDEMAKKIADLTTQNQGATFNLGKGDLAGTPNYAVSTYPQHSLVTPGAPDLNVIKQYLQQHMDLLGEGSDNSVGTWHDREKNNFVTDVVKTIPDREKAMQLGAEHNQDAIFDLGKLEEIRLPKGLSKAEFATELAKNPSIADSLQPMAAPSVDSVQPMGKAAQDIADRRQQPFGRPPVGVTERRQGEIASGVTNPVSKVPVSDTRYKELLQKFGMEQPPTDSVENIARNAPYGNGGIVPGPLPTEMLKMEHRSPVAGLTELDPTKQGTNPGMLGAERLRREEPNYGPRGYLSKEGATNIEARLKKLNVYDTEAPKSTVYDLEKDPLGLIAQAQETSKTGTSSLATNLEDAIRKGGFKGIDDGSGTIIYFDRLPLKQRLMDQKGSVTLEPFVNLLKMRKGQPEFGAPALRRMEQSIKAGSGSEAKWSPLSNHGDAFGGDELGPHTFARFWGATSPNTPVSRNNYEAIRAWKAMLDGDIPFTADKARANDITMVGAKVPNLNRALENAPLQGGRGETGKTEAMSRLVAGKPDSYETPNIPIDIHALSGLGAGEGDVASIYPKLREYLDAHQGKQPRTYTELYNIAANVYRKGLEKFGEDVFPTMWEGVKVLKGQGESSGMTNWLKAKGLLEPGQMVNPKALDDVIRNIDRAEFYGRGSSAKKGK